MISDDRSPGAAVAALSPRAPMGRQTIAPGSPEARRGPYAGCCDPAPVPGSAAAAASRPRGTQVPGTSGRGRGGGPLLCALRAGHPGRGPAARLL